MPEKTPAPLSETELEDFGDIIDTLYTKYKDAIGFEIKSLDKVYDMKTKEYTYYVGLGLGIDEESDIELIVNWGTKYSEEHFKEVFNEFMGKKYLHF